MDKLSINNEMGVFDRKDREFYDSLTVDERKKFSNFLMIRYGSSVQGNNLSPVHQLGPQTYTLSAVGIDMSVAVIPAK